MALINKYKPRLDGDGNCQITIRLPRSTVRQFNVYALEATHPYASLSQWIANMVQFAIEAKSQPWWSPKSKRKRRR